MKLATRLDHARHQLATPGRGRTVLVRRTLAGALVLAAGASAAASLRGNPEVYVFAAEVHAGAVVQESDVELRRIPATVLPDVALSHGESPVGSIAVSRGTPGEVITPARLLGVSETTQSFSQPGLHMVPLKLAEPDIAPLLRHGDTVSIVTATGDTAPGAIAALPEAFVSDSGNGSPAVPVHNTAATLIAAGGRVVSTALPEGEHGQSRPGTILVALPAADADRVAAASLSGPLTVVITGPRAAGAGSAEPD